MHAPVYHGGCGGRDGRGSSICAWKLYILQEDKCDGFGNNAPVHHVYPVRVVNIDMYIYVVFTPL